MNNPHAICRHQVHHLWKRGNIDTRHSHSLRDRPRPSHRPHPQGMPLPPTHQSQGVGSVEAVPQVCSALALPCSLICYWSFSSSVFWQTCAACVDEGPTCCHPCSGIPLQLNSATLCKCSIQHHTVEPVRKGILTHRHDDQNRHQMKDLRCGSVQVFYFSEK